MRFLATFLLGLTLHLLQGAEAETSAFVQPGKGIPSDRPVWGHREGLRIGLAPSPGPHGLIRIYAPYLGQEFPRMVNFISVEPTVVGNRVRGQSELESSRHRLLEQGLSFYGSENALTYPEGDTLPSGLIDTEKGTLRLFIHPEPFSNGARPVIEVIFHKDQPHAVEFLTLVHPDSKPLAECVLSATMGNYGLLRELRIGDRVISSSELWPDPGAPHDPLGFLPWKTFGMNEREGNEEGFYIVDAISDLQDPSTSNYPDNVPRSWRYRGRPARHIWKTNRPTVVAVNARTTYWSTKAAIPGGPSIENFELRSPFQVGQSFVFSIEPIAPESP